ncbi:M20 metallopeptidase family protein [Aestuariimicrobium ganziense]|uniref:M20 metallopeptidase family protein n=1 Tax=Aestuariimicrobium ganziense TaxID=2773677 RepID=UPI002E2A0C8E|nr:M20 family metallopeptidase [Aestuariimicrobium ganziense]
MGQASITRQSADRLADHLVALRRELHQIPEVGLDLPQTQARLLTELEGLPLEISLGESLTSITAVLRGGAAPDDLAQRPVVLLRGDMDALPVDEQTGLEFASSNGAMHACGHDLHMAVLVGAVKVLCELSDDLAGDVVFMFQPGEEGRNGASHMLREGILDAAGKRVDAAFALHVFSALERAGTFATRPGTIMASSDLFHVTVTGRGGHGSTPHLALDPVPALAEIATAFHTLVTRKFSIFNPVVVTVGQIHAGTAGNVIPENGFLEATLRTFDRDVRTRLIAELERVAVGIGEAHGVEITTNLEGLYPVTVNDDDQFAFTADTIRELFGDDRFVEWAQPLAGAEDFSQVLEEVPGCYIGLGAVPDDLDPQTAPFNHSAYAVFDDSVLADGAALLAELAVRTITRLNNQKEG